MARLSKAELADIQGRIDETLAWGARDLIMGAYEVESLLADNRKLKRARRTITKLNKELREAQHGKD